MKKNRIKFSLVLAIMCIASFGALLASSHAADTPAPWGFSTANLDKSCKPCDDFYKFAMGGWMKNNPIPADRPGWSTSAELQEKNLAQLRQITEASAVEERMAMDCARRIRVAPPGNLAARIDARAVRGLPAQGADGDRNVSQRGAKRCGSHAHCET